MKKFLLGVVGACVMALVGCGTNLRRPLCSDGEMAFPPGSEGRYRLSMPAQDTAQTGAWTGQEQTEFMIHEVADAFELEVTVCHYPRGASKWNPIEHRLFSFISINWAGKPLRSWLLMLGYIQDTTTETGLKVKAVLLPGTYKTGVKVADQEMQKLRLRRHKTCPSWNYTIKPRKQRQQLSKSAK